MMLDPLIQYFCEKCGNLWNYPPNARRARKVCPDCLKARNQRSYKECLEYIKELEEVRSLHRLLFRRLQPVVKAWQEEMGEKCVPDLGELVEWMMTKWRGR